ncbi:MAG: flagellar biosynthesis protein FlhF [Planctomycetes bacterium]|nr:flagellar biosynthesis protein FlhF [Planctomycetota bacterium]
MEIKTYRAATMHDALALVRRELGPDAAVLHTREIRRRRLFSWLSGAREIEVTASAGVNVPSRLSRRAPQPSRPAPPPPPSATPSVAEEVQSQLSHLQAMMQDLCQHSRPAGQRDLPEGLFKLFTDLIEADLSEEVARELVERARAEAPDSELTDPVLAKAGIARMLEAEISIAGPISVASGRRRLVALVGPTGVGKTTTIAKLAANYRLREKHKVGLITVDTYRIAAVEQLRTYADIIDLPMEVVSTPREMREAVRRLDDMDLILMDTAGRSPRDDIKIRELKAFLTEAEADEVHLVLSSVASGKTLRQTAQRFAAVGTTALILTKLDEATGLGDLVPVLRSSELPLSYLTNGQNVPDDIEVADRGRLTRLLLGIESVT